MADTQQQIIDHMLSVGEFTFGGVVAKFGGHDSDNYRVVDRTIQKLRRAGKIKKRREGNTFIWSKTTNG
jgi:predicted transcriptional regulator